MDKFLYYIVFKIIHEAADLLYGLTDWMCDQSLQNVHSLKAYYAERMTGNIAQTVIGIVAAVKRGLDTASGGGTTNCRGCLN